MTDPELIERDFASKSPEIQNAYRIRALCCHDLMEHLNWALANDTDAGTRLELAELASTAFLGFQTFCLEHVMLGFWDQWGESLVLVRLSRDSLLGEHRLN